jgi:DNA repair exonuclease SbcCD ATPase subunit
METQQDITETSTETAPEGLAEDTAPVEAGLADDTAPEGEVEETAEASESPVGDEAPEFFDLTDADLGSFTFKRKVGEEEKIYKLQEMIEHFERFGTLKQVQDVQSLYRKLEQERPQIEQKAKQEFETYRQQVEPVIQRVQAYEQRLQTDPGGVMLDIAKQMLGEHSNEYHNFRAWLNSPPDQGGVGYNPQQYAQRYQAQQAPQYHQQAQQQAAILEGERAIFSVTRELKLDLTSDDEAKVKQEAARLWQPGADPVAVAKQAVIRLQRLGEIKAPKPAPVMAKPTLSQQIQKQLAKPKQGAQQTGTGGAPPRKSRALEIAEKLGA